MSILETNRKIHSFLVPMRTDPNIAPIFADWLEDNGIRPEAWLPLRSYSSGQIVLKGVPEKVSVLAEGEKYTYIYNLLFPFPPDIKWTTSGRLIPLKTKVAQIMAEFSGVPEIYWSSIAITKHGLVLVERDCGKVLLARKQGIKLVKVRTYGK